jgi:ankyrin repeat protein
VFLLLFKDHFVIIIFTKIKCRFVILCMTRQSSFIMNDHSLLVRAIAQRLLLTALDKHSPEWMRRALAMGANVNAVRQGRSLLVDAIKAGDFVRVRMLLDANADLRCLDTPRHSILYSLLFRGARDMFCLLVERGANVHVLVHGSVPLVDIALKHEDTRFAIALIRAGALSTMTGWDQTRIALAHLGDIQLLQCLLRECP